MDCGKVEHDEHKKSEKKADEYHFDTYVAAYDEFKTGFSEFLNQKASSGREYEECQYVTEGNNLRALCVFEKD
jgi:hypothetical protein